MLRQLFDSVRGRLDAGHVRFLHAVIAVLQATVTVGCQGPVRVSVRDPGEMPRAALAASFVNHDSAGLRRLLHADLLVQPPSPDSVLQGSRAVEYLTRLAVHTSVDDSHLQPAVVTPEGPFTFEQGIWQMGMGTRLLQGHYVLRWRMMPDGWKVVLWRWSAFR